MLAGCGLCGALLRLVPGFPGCFLGWGGELKRIKKERNGWRKVTSGIWVVTHSSAGERLGYTHDHSFLRG